MVPSPELRERLNQYFEKKVKDLGRDADPIRIGTIQAALEALKQPRTKGFGIAQVSGALMCELVGNDVGQSEKEQIAELREAFSQEIEDADDAREDLEEL